MSDRWGWDKERIALAVRVGTMVTVLGFVLLAAEQRLARDFPQQEVVAGEIVPSADTAPPAAPAPAEKATPGYDYWPGHFAVPSTDRDDEQPSTF
jgi:hypothetical protein